MKRALLLLPLLCCCQRAPQSSWNCESGVKIYRYIEKNGETRQYEVDYSKESARFYGRVNNLHEDTLGYTDLGLFKGQNYIGFGNILINSNIFNLNSWSRDLNQCRKIKQYKKNDDDFAVVNCSENRKFGYLEYIFSRERGIKNIKLVSLSETKDYSLIDTEGLGKLCNP